MSVLLPGSTGASAVPVLAPAGEQVGLLAFAAPNPIHRRSEIYTIRTDGSRLVQLTTTGAWGPAWSPDGAQIAYERGGKVWVMNADGGGRQALASGSEPAWAPDGRHLSYACTDGGGLCVMDLSTKAVTVPVASSDQWLGAGGSSWSPDGTSIVFTRYSVDGDDYTNYRNLWVVHPDGTGLAEVPNTGTQANDPAWSPDGDTIVYTDRYGGRGGEDSGNLFAIHPDGTGKVQLTTEYGDDGSAAWASGGTRIALSSDPVDRDYQSGIWTMNPDGTGRELVVRNGYDPSWHPTFTGATAPPLPAPTDAGQRIAYVAATDSGYDLFVVRPDGTGKRRLTTHGAAAQPAWSPNHRRLAYVHTGFRTTIRIIDFRTGSIRVLWPRYASSGLDWSPDGRQLVWSDGGDRLVIANVRTGVRHRIRVGFGVTAPVWSPGGKWIAYGQGYFSSGSIKMVRVSDGAVRRVTDLPGNEVLPAWSPDGKWIAFTREEDHPRYPRVVSLAMIHPNGTGGFRLLRTGGVDASPSWSTDGTRIAAYSDGSRPFRAAPHPGLWTMGKSAGNRHLVVQDRAITDVAW